MSDFVTIDETLIPEGGEGNREPLAEGAYNATCVAMVTGVGTKYQSTETEQKVRMVFAVEEEGSTYFLRTNWMKLSLHDGQPQPSALWLVLAAWTNQKTAKALIEKMGKFDLKFFIGKPIQLGVKIKDKYNDIDSFYAPKKGQTAITVEEIPEFLISGDKKVTDNIKFITIEGAKIKPKKVKEGDVVVPNSKSPVASTPVEAPSDDLPFN